MDPAEQALPGGPDEPDALEPWAEPVSARDADVGIAAGAHPVAVGEAVLAPTAAASLRVRDRGAQPAEPATVIRATSMCDAVTSSGKFPGLDALNLIVAGRPAGTVRSMP